MAEAEVLPATPPSSSALVLLGGGRGLATNWYVLIVPTFNVTFSKSWLGVKTYLVIYTLILHI